MTTFAQRLISARENAGLTQQQLAERFGKKQSLIGNLESKARSSSSYIPEIAHVLGIDAYWLKTGIKTLVAGDSKIDEVVEAMKRMSAEGKAIVLDKARDMEKQYPKRSLENTA